MKLRPLALAPITRLACALLAGATAALGNEPVTADPVTKPAAPAVPVTVTIDAARVVGPVRRWERYQNNSLRHAPPVTLAPKVAATYGRPAIMRSWLCLDDLWDYRTGEYRFNYRVGENFYAGDKKKFGYDRDRVTKSDVNYEDYLRSFGDNCDEILLNIRRYEREVTKGVITLEQWKQVVKTGLLHYKKLVPNLRYLEVLNEWQFPHFGGLSDDQYYDFYRASYEVVNEVNAELKPALPLLVGGPNLYSKNKGLKEFFARFAADPNPAKRLDFVSFHEYHLGGNPAGLADFARASRALMTEAGLTGDVLKAPVFITEFGVGSPKKDPAFNLSQAAFVTAAQHAARNEADLVLFPWVLFHAPIQVSLVQFTQDLKLTPYGMATKMQALSRDHELAATSSNYNKQGRGVGVLATGDKTSLTVKIWNCNAAPAAVEVKVDHLPAWAANGKARLHVVDSKRNNVFTDPSAGTELTGELVGPPPWKVDLEPNALALWLIEAP